MPQTVKGVIARSKGADVELVDIVVPDPGPGEAVVQVQSCGVCHTDLHYREGGINDEFPFLLGHEAAGIVEGRVAIVDPARIGLGLTVFVGIEAPDHGTDWREAFAAAVRDIPEIVEVFRMAGDLDYLLRAVVPDMAAFDALYRRLTEAIPIKNVTSHFAMERIKATTVYPLDTLTR